jgi:hypothetical protein
MKKQILVLMLAAVMVFTLCACGVSSSSTTTTTFSTSKTDADGNTTTKTVTNEMGVSAGTDGIQTKNETTSSETTSVAGNMAEFFPPKEDWYDLYVAGGECVDEDGDEFYFAYGDPDMPDMTEAILLVLLHDGDVKVRNGQVTWNEEDECFELYDADVDEVIPFVLPETEEDNLFVMRFLANNYEVTFETVDQDTIINDIYDILLNTVPGSPAEGEVAEEAAEETAENAA